VTSVIINRLSINNEGADEMILPLFPAFLSYCELLWQHFPRVFLKLQLCRIYQVLHVPPQEVARKFSRLEEHSRCFTMHQHNIYDSLLEKMIYKNFVVIDENCHWLKLMYLFLRHVV
jgi:hypothetical protein